MPLPKDEDAEEFKVMRSKPLPSIEDVMSGKTYQHEARPPTQPYYGRYQQSEAPQLKSPSQPQAVYVRPPPA